MKRHLRQKIGLHILSFEELIVVIQMQSILNSRPLAAMSNDPKDLQPITPAFFLLGRPANYIHSTIENIDGTISLTQIQTVRTSQKVSLEVLVKRLSGNTPSTKKMACFGTIFCGRRFTADC